MNVERYVAEVDLPAPVFAEPRVRKHLANAQYYGCTKGYWCMLFDEDPLGNKRPLGLRLTIEFSAEDSVAAEDQA